MLQAGLIVAGWDKHDGGSVFAIPLGGTIVKTPFSLGGSGSAYIYGFCDKNWRPVRLLECSLALLVFRSSHPGYRK